MFAQIFSLIISHLLLPAMFIYWFAKNKYQSRSDWIVLMLMSGTYVCYIFVAGRWDWLSFYWRYLFGILFIWYFFKTLPKIKSLPKSRRRVPRDKLVFGIQVLVFIVFGIFLFFSLKGRSYDGPAEPLQFPLKDGAYYVAQGGNAAIINFHNLGLAQKYALDIVKMYPWGTRARGLYPKELSKYAIYGDTVFSPCDGVISQVRDSLDDQIPPEKNPRQPAGNFIGIKTGSFHVYLAHLQRGSVMVKVGDSVKVGQPLARVGNTGYTSEPHLHIHAERGDSSGFLQGEGVPLTFDGRFLVRNDIVKRFKNKKSSH